MTERNPTVAIIGAGPGGTCCAAMLSQLGIDAFIVERSTFPRFTIGESLLPISLGHLEDAGLLDAVNAAGFLEKPGAVFNDGVSVPRIDFSYTKNIRHGHAFNLRRDRFDAVLADAVAQRGVPFHWNTTVTDATFEADRWTLHVQNPQGVATLEADFVVDASGAALIARLGGSSPPPPDGPRRGSVFCHLNDPDRAEGFEGRAIWILSCATDAWGWIIPFADGTASLGFVSTEDEITAHGETAEEQFAGMFDLFAAPKSRFAPPDFVRVQPRAIFGYRRAFNSPFGAGYCLVGNSIGFVDPVFSSGVAVATESAVRAAHAIAAHFEGDYDWQSEYADPLLAGMRTLSDCSDCWYEGTLRELIYAGEEDLPFRRDIISILAGGAWDKTNSLTKDTEWSLRYLLRKLRDRRVNKAVET